MENNEKNIQYNKEDRPYKIYLLKTRINESFNKERGHSNDNTNRQKESKRKNNDTFSDFYTIEPSGSNFQIMNPLIG